MKIDYLVMRFVFNVVDAEVQFEENYISQSNSGEVSVSGNSVSEPNSYVYTAERCARSRERRRKKARRASLETRSHGQGSRNRRVSCSCSTPVILSLLITCALGVVWLFGHSTFFGFGETERCSGWLPEANLTGLEVDLESSLFGQHIAVPIIVSRIKRHLLSVDRSRSRKPLTLLLYGPTGTGKTYASRIVGQHLFTAAMSSRFSERVFLPHVVTVAERSNGNKKLVKMLFDESIRQCGQKAYFVVEEADKGLEQKLVADIIPVLNGRRPIETSSGTSSNAVVFLIVNFAASALQQRVMAFRKLGRSRLSLDWSDVNVLSRKIFSDEVESQTDLSSTPAWRLVKHLLEEEAIDAAVPFLPLEVEQVRQCIASNMKQKRLLVTKEKEDRVLADLIFSPRDNPLFSVSGCKRVDRTVDFHFG